MHGCVLQEEGNHPAGMQLSGLSARASGHLAAEGCLGPAMAAENVLANNNLHCHEAWPSMRSMTATNAWPTMACKSA